MVNYYCEVFIRLVTDLPSREKIFIWAMSEEKIAAEQNWAILQNCLYMIVDDTKLVCFLLKRNTLLVVT